MRCTSRGRSGKLVSILKPGSTVLGFGDFRTPQSSGILEPGLAVGLRGACEQRGYIPHDHTRLFEMECIARNHTVLKRAVATMIILSPSPPDLRTAATFAPSTRQASYQNLNYSRKATCRGLPSAATASELEKLHDMCNVCKKEVGFAGSQTANCYRTKGFPNRIQEKSSY